MPQRPIVARCNQVTAEVEEVRDGGVDIDEPLRLKRGFEPPHSPLSYPGLLMRQLGPVVGVPTGVVHGARQQHVDDLTVLVDGPPQVPLPASDPDEDLVHEDGVAVAAVPAPQSMRVMGPEPFAPETDRLVGDEDASPGQQILDVPVAEVEAVIEPNGVPNDFSRKSVAPV